ncbi:MAG: hypothetical protein U5R14_07540 [Gemmatimonadota bacterium]|nr:hypothetical protein [Gemmatimonadota bacterium]
MRGYVGGEILIATPVGEFAENVGTGFGVGLFGRYTLDDRQIVSLRADVGFLNITGARRSGEAEYLRKGDIEDLPDGSVVLNPRRSETNFWTFRVGVSVGLPRGRDRRRR